MKWMFLILMFLLLVLVYVSVYCWVDVDGNIYFGDWLLVNVLLCEVKVKVFEVGNDVFVQECQQWMWDFFFEQ